LYSKKKLQEVKVFLLDNGAAVIVDDELKEAMPLIKVLGKHHIPVSYVKGGNRRNLPKSPIKNARVVFLDLNLLPPTSSDEKNVRSTLIMNLRQIISNENGPYVLIVWSVNEHKYESILDDIFSNELKSIKPSLKLTLSKKDYFDRTDNGGLSPKKGLIEALDVRIREELEKAKSLSLLFSWQNIINKASGEIARELLSFYNEDENWDANLQKLFNHLAKANLGNRFDDCDSAGISTNCLLTLNGTFVDLLSRKIRKHDFSDIELNNNKDHNSNKDQSGKDEVELEVKARINTKLHTENRVEEHFAQPGNVYLIDSNYGQEFRLDAEKIYDGKFSNFKEKDDLQYIFLEVTPKCDFSQGKFSFYRFLSGVLWPAEKFKKIKRAENLFVSPFDLYFERKRYRLVFDNNFLHTRAIEGFEDLMVYFRIKPELLFNIQTRMANHISRPGVISVV
jgi:hypothetical protein